MAEPSIAILERFYQRLEQARNLLTNVEPKNKFSRALLDATISELDTLVAQAQSFVLKQEQADA